MNISMNKETLKAIAKEFAKEIKTQDDLNLFFKELVNLTVEATLNAEVTEHLGYEKK